MIEVSSVGRKRYSFTRFLTVFYDAICNCRGSFQHRAKAEHSAVQRKLFSALVTM